MAGVDCAIMTTPPPPSTSPYIRDAQFTYFFFFCCLCFDLISKETLSNPIPKRFSPIFLLIVLIISVLTFRSLIHLELIFVDSVNSGFNFNLYMWISSVVVVI